MAKILFISIGLAILVAPCRSQSTCAMCPDGSIELENPERVIPFFNLSPTNSNPTCQQVADAAFSPDTDGVDCDLVQAQAGYCGCKNVPTQGICNFCPNGGSPGRSDEVVPTGDACGDLDLYARYLSAEDCESKRFESMQGLAFICGCPNVKPACTLCPDGSDPPNPDKVVFPTGETCQDMVEEIQGYTADVCEDSETTVTVSAARCDCPESPFPICSVQQNPRLCTDELLDSAIEEGCECYSFCDGEFTTCHDFPGGLLNSQLCPGIAVSGCNRARVQATEKLISSAESRNRTSLLFVATMMTALLQQFI